MEEELIYRTGVYRIINTITKDFYIGSASRTSPNKSKSYRGFYVRINRHKMDLRANRHYNQKLQRAWNKYGEENFNFEILMICSPEECIKNEQYYLDLLSPTYNIKKTAESNLGIKLSEEHKKNLGISIKKALASMKDQSWKIRAAEGRRGRKYIKKSGFKVSEEGRISNRDKRRKYSHIAKLNVDSVREIKILLAEGKTQQYCAKKYNVSQGAISCISIGRTWIDVTI
jgi:group I intron endonuclease